MAKSKHFLKNLLYGNILFRFGYEITEGFSECVTQQKYITARKPSFTSNFTKQ